MTAALQMSTPGGYLLVLAVLLPLVGIIVSFIPGGRLAERVVLGSAPLGFALACLIAFHVGQSGKPIVYTIGGLPPPLGIALRADGISAFMLVTAAMIVTAAAFYGRAKFSVPEGVRESRSSLTFWVMLQAIWAALTIIFVGGDLFNLYVALELLTFAAVPLVCIDGRPETLAAALRYLLFALFGSICYLLGVALFYGAHGTIDISLLAQRVQPTPVVWLAAALMTAGLLAKTALVPLHLWLPPAHANAPAAASAVLSGLVVKGSFFLTLRLWFFVLPALHTQMAATIFGVLGSMAIIIGSAVALRQARLKLLIAYSTVAQIGYLFLIFPLASGGTQTWSAIGWSAGLMQVLAHAFAKTAMFFSAGVLAEAFGHDQIAKLRGAARVMPLTFLTIGLAGLSLMGLPPSGGFTAKWLMLQAAAMSGGWFWTLPILIGGLLAAGYVYRILSPALSDGQIPQQGVPLRSQEVIAFILVIIALALGFAPQAFYDFLEIGRPMMAGLP